MQHHNICTDSCSKDAFYCAADKMCVHSGSRCDGYQSCPSGEDEAGCGEI